MRPPSCEGGYDPPRSSPARARSDRRSPPIQSVHCSRCPPCRSRRRPYRGRHPRRRPIDRHHRRHRRDADPVRPHTRRRRDPGLGSALGVGAAEAAWILTVFILALAGTLLVCGRLGDLVGHRQMFGAGTLVYAFGAILGGLSPGLGMLLVARALQGVGAAMVSATTWPFSRPPSPPSSKGRAIAVVATTASVFCRRRRRLRHAGARASAIGRCLFLAPAPLRCGRRGARSACPTPTRVHARRR